MKIPHPAYPQFATGCMDLARQAAKPYAGLGFRFATLRYAHSRDLLSGEGARNAGGRLNSPGTFAVIYTSTDPATATAEAFQNFADFGFGTYVVRPRVFVGLDVKVGALLDLSDEPVRSQLTITMANLAEPWWPVQETGHEALTQALGRAAYEAGFEAILLPSARRKGGFNLNVFPEKLRAGSAVRVIEEQDLERYLK